MWGDFTTSGEVKESELITGVLGPLAKLGESKEKSCVL